MLSRILDEDQKDNVQPLLLKRAGGPATVPSTSAATATPAPKPLAPHPPAPQVMHRAQGGHFQPESVLQDQINTLQRKVAEVEEAANRREQEARQTGFREGEAAGRKQATDQIQPVLDKMAQSIREIGELRPKLRHEAETDVVKLASAIARKILHRELNADPEALSALIRLAMDKIRVNELVRVRVHPQHHAPIQQILTRVTLGAQVELQADPRLQVGGLVIETTRGEFDASVETQLREIERGLTDKLTHAGRHG